MTVTKLHNALRGLAAALLAAAVLAGCSGAGALNMIISDDGYTRHQNLAYGTASRQVLDVYEPKTVVPAGGRPVVVFFYGGSWRGGSRETYLFVGEALTSRGYLAILPDYRVYPDARYPDFVEDAAQAVKWATENAARYGGNPDRIVLMGHSAGAHIAALVALDPQFLIAVGLQRETVKGFVGLAGPYSFDPLQYRVTRAVFGHLQNPDVVRPVIYAANDAPPMLLLHGRDDTTVGPFNSADLAQALKQAGQRVTHTVYDDVAHIGIILALAKPFRGRAPTLSDASAFIDGLMLSDSATYAR